MITSHSQRGFTFVELAIVITIIGLIIGGVMAGQSLIKSSSLGVVTKEMTALSSAITSFRDKYRQLPGDISDATRYWGTNATCPVPAAGFSTKSTCNGNGDGSITTHGATHYEYLYIWHHLNSAGLINGFAVSNFGNYATLSGATPALIPRRNVPGSKFEGGGFSISHYTSTGSWADDIFPPGSDGLIISFGGRGASGVMNGRILLPEDAQAIDAKIDDGRIAAGAVIGAADDDTCVEGASNGTYLYNNVNLAYNLDSTTPSCYLGLRYE